MLDKLICDTTRYQGIVLNCRRDFEASKVWPRLGHLKFKSHSA